MNTIHICFSLAVITGVCGARSAMEDLASIKPTRKPSLQVGPSKKPTSVTAGKPSRAPTSAPTRKNPTSRPSGKPSQAPTRKKPTSRPSGKPSQAPTRKKPTSRPSGKPSQAPTRKKPTSRPTGKPSEQAPTSAVPLDCCGW